jgi:hypothetical protein
MDAASQIQRAGRDRGLDLIAKLLPLNGFILA